MVLHFCQGIGPCLFASVEGLFAHVEEFALVDEALNKKGHSEPHTPTPEKGHEGVAGMSALPLPRIPGGARPGGLRPAIGAWGGIGARPDLAVGGQVVEAHAASKATIAGDGENGPAPEDDSAGGSRSSDSAGRKRAPMIRSNSLATHGGEAPQAMRAIG